MAPAKERATITIRGKVQGVFFRKYALEKAQSLLLNGFVHNAPDGTVVIVAEGPNEDIKSLASWCQKGPPLAEVAHMDIQWTPATGEFLGFRIHYDEANPQGG